MAAAYRQLGMIRKVDGVTAKEIILIIEEQNIIPDQNSGEKNKSRVSINIQKGLRMRHNMRQSARSTFQ